MDYKRLYYRRKGRGIRFLIAALSVVSLAGCQTVNVANVEDADYSLAEDEHRLMKRADEFIEDFDRSNYIYDDPSLEAYLNGMADKMLSQKAKEQGINITVKVLKDPVFNAFTFANGRIYIHTGIFAACENEAQLATLIAHEIVHAINRHALRTHRSVRNKSAFGSSVGTLGLAGLLAQLGTVSSIAGYSHILEYEADEGGFKIALAQGYDMSESPRLFETIEVHLDEEDIKLPYFFSSHPRIKKRTKNYYKLLEEHQVAASKDGTNDSPEFDKFYKDILAENIVQCLKIGYFKTGERFIDRYIKMYPGEALGLYQRGELYRQRQDTEKKKKLREKTPDYPLALAAYEEAIALDQSFAAAYKGKAQVLRKMGKDQEAKDIYRKYLKLNADAHDRAYIEHFINS